MSISGSIQSDRMIYQKYTSRGEYLDVSGYTGNIKWGVSSGTLLPGVYLRPDGARVYIKGTPVTSGDYRFTVRATDSRNAYTEKKCAVKVHDEPYETADMTIEGSYPNATMGAGHDSYVYVTGFSGTPRWSVSSDSYSPFSASPAHGDRFYIGGNPAKAGTYTFTLRATDSREAYTEKQFTVNVSGDSVELMQTTDMSLSGIFAEGYTVSEWYSSSVQVSGGTADYRLSVESGSLPPGFYIRQDGARFYLEGVPDKAGTYKFKLRVIDSRKTYAEKEFTVKINGEHSESDEMTLTGNFPEAYTASTWYSQKVQADGGTREYTYSITSGDLPAGFFIRQDGPDFWLDGIPNTAGTYTFTLEVTDSHNQYTARTFTISVYEPVKITTSTLPDGRHGVSYNAQIEASGTAVTWTLRNTGGSDTAIAGREYTHTFTAEGGVTSWRISSGDVPGGLTLANDGTISGTPSASGTFTFTVNAANSLTEDSREFTLTVDPKPAPALKPKITLPKSGTTAYAGSSYTLQPTASGTAPVTWSSAGDLPPGLAIDQATGRLSDKERRLQHRDYGRRHGAYDGMEQILRESPQRPHTHHEQEQPHSLHHRKPG